MRTGKLAGKLPDLFGSSALGWVCTFVGLIANPFIAARIARSAVAEAKFCEGCNVHMTRLALSEISWQALPVVINALAERRMATAAEACGRASGRDAVPVLFFCPQCGEGYVEMQATFIAQWHEPGKDSPEMLVEEWRVASCPLTARDVVGFRKLAVRS